VPGAGRSGRTRAKGLQAGQLIGAGRRADPRQAGIPRDVLVQRLALVAAGLQMGVVVAPSAQLDGIRAIGLGAQEVEEVHAT